MDDRREDILWVVPHPTPTSVTVSGAKQAMDTYMKECCLELLDYMAKKGMMCFVENGVANFTSENGYVLLSKEQLFENFL